MRALVHQSLKNSADPRLLPVSGRVYAFSTLGRDGVPADPDKPYLMHKEINTVPYQEVRETSRARAKVIQIFAYDHTGSYDRIDSILDAVRDTILGLEGQRSPLTEALCMRVSEDSTSGDLKDDTTGLNVKFSIYRFTSSK